MKGGADSQDTFAVIVPDCLPGSQGVVGRMVLLPAESALVRVVSEFIGSLWLCAEQMSTSQRCAMGRQLVEMMRLCTVPALPDPESGRCRLCVEDIRAHVDQHLTDVELTPGSVAKTFDVSVRYLHKIMRESGQTLCRYILDARLENSRGLLGDPALMSETVTEIAFRSGFSSMTHFSRVFRERFGCSPTAYRRLQMGK